MVLPQGVLRAATQGPALMELNTQSRKGAGRGGSRGRGGPPAGAARIAVPASVVGAVIGKGGETIKRLTLETGARIEVSKDAVEGAEERSIFLSGPPEAVEQARKLIEALVRDRSGPRGGSGHASRSGAVGSGNVGRGGSGGGRGNPRGAE